MGLIKDLEKVQMRATKLVITKTPQVQRETSEIKITVPTLRFRRIRGDMIEMYKILILQKCQFALRTASG